MDDPADFSAVLRDHWPSQGPEWDRAISEGIDVTALLRNLQLTPEQRLVRLQKRRHAIAVLRQGLVRG